MTHDLYRIAFVVLLLLATASGPAAAQTGIVTARSGESVRVDAYMGWRDDCSHLPIDIDIVAAPAHGSLTPEIGSETIGRASIGQANTCMGRTVRALVLFYKSNEGYRGTDAFQVRIAVGNQPATYDYVVNVR